MSRRLIVLTTLAATALLASVQPVAAKAWYQARLDAPISRDAVGGTTITVSWQVDQIVGEDRLPIEGPMPIYLRLIPMTRGAEATEVIGTPDPPGSGHFVGTLVVPDGGVARVEAGIHNEACAGGQCERWDMPIELVGTVLVFGPGLGSPGEPAANDPAPANEPAQANEPAGVAAPAAAPAGLTATLPLFLVAGAVIAGLIGLVVVIRTARSPRRRDAEPAID